MSIQTLAEKSMIHTFPTSEGSKSFTARIDQKTNDGNSHDCSKPRFMLGETRVHRDAFHENTTGVGKPCKPRSQRRNYENFEIRLLRDHEVPLAQELLHEIYCQFGEWTPTSDNPTGIRTITDEEGRQLLVDRYDSCCYWFGCFDQQGRLIGTHRLQPKRDTWSKLDLENYIDLPEEFSDRPICELARLAIHPDYQGTYAVLALLHFAFTWMKNQNFECFVSTAAFPSPGELYLKMGALLHESPAFKYDAKDPSECRLIYFEFDQEYCESKAAKVGNLVRRFRGN